MKKNAKRTLSLVLCLALLVAAVPTFVFAAGSASITIDASSYSAGVDTTSVSLPIKVEATNVNVANWTLTYDTDVFESASVALESGIAGELDEINAQNVIFWEADDVQTISGNFITLTLVLKSGAKTGDTTVSISGTMTDDEYEDIDVSASTTLNITDGTSGGDTTSGYEVSLVNPSTDLVAVGDSVALNVNVNNVFNSTKMTLSYDPNYLTFVNGDVANGQTMGDDDQAVSITGANGVITIIDYGTAFASGAAYTLNFTAAAATTGTEVEVTYAGLSTAEEAEDSDLTVATTLGKVSVPVGYTVTVPTTTTDYSFTASASTVVPGGSVDITVNNPYYDYVLSATGGTLNTTDAGWTVSNVTGDVTVSVTSATPKSYNVTVKIVDSEGNEITDDTNNSTGGTATYNTEFSYTLPDDTAAGTNAGVQYTLKSITVGENAATYTTSDRTYTIAGANVIGDIVVTVTKQDLDPNAFTVSTTGNGASAGTLTATQVDKGGDAVLTLSNKETGYTYTVTATMEGTDNVAVEVSGDTYTVSNVTGNVVFTISKSLDLTSLSVTQYVQLDNTVMWLVKINGNGTSQIEGKTYTYDDNNMFWSSKYQAYCYLIVAESNPYDTTNTESVAAFVKKIGLTGTAAISISYNGNVNLTADASGAAVIDVNDAQLVWNMYSAVYSDTNTVSVQKFLEADMNGNGSLSTEDAAVVIGLLG